MGELIYFLTVYTVHGACVSKGLSVMYNSLSCIQCIYPDRSMFRQ